MGPNDFEWSDEDRDRQESEELEEVKKLIVEDEDTRDE